MENSETVQKPEIKKAYKKIKTTAMLYAIVLVVLTIISFSASKWMSASTSEVSVVDKDNYAYIQYEDYTARLMSENGQVILYHDYTMMEEHTFDVSASTSKEGYTSITIIDITTNQVYVVTKDKDNNIMDKINALYNNENVVNENTEE